MTRKTRNAAALAAVVAVAAGIFGIARKYPLELAPDSQNVAATLAPTLSDNQIADEIRQREAQISNLTVRQVGGIVILRGTATGRAEAVKAVDAVNQLGFSRVANLLAISPGIDDEGIRREAERQLAIQRGLDGCRFAVRCDRGVLQVSGKVQNDAQEEVARMVLRNVQGAKQVQADFVRF
jgi:osmotically-inducible protein OsmY